MSPDIKHKHLLIRAECESVPTEESQLIEWTRQLIMKIDMELISGPMTAYVREIGNRGLTAVAIIKTSSIVCHVWDEDMPGLIHLDVYSCKDFKIENVFEHLKEFNPIKIQYKFLDRETDLIDVVSV